MELNTAVIPHYDCRKIPLDKLKHMVLINNKHLKEKPTWYTVNGKLKYFKIRDDYRLFTEQFFSLFGRQIMNLDTVDYQVASIRLVDGLKGSNEHMIGLLSDNFQNKDNNYYLANDLFEARISDLVSYGNYSFKTLLTYLKQILTEECYNKNRDFFIKLFISDAFMFQADRNYNNIGFQIPAIKNINYQDRLRAANLVKSELGIQYVEKEDNLFKLKDFYPSKVYDSEKMLGIEQRNSLIYTPGMTWMPAFPFSDDLKFENQSQAQKISQDSYSGLDPNLVELYMEYPDICKPYLERLAYDNEYKKILEQFSYNNSQIYLKNDTKDYVNMVLEDRRKQFKKVLDF